MHFLESFRVNPSIAGRPEILHLSNPWKTLLIEYSVSPSKTDANGFVFEPIAMDSINNKLMNGDRNTSGDNDEVNLNLKSLKTPTVTNEKKRIRTTPSTASSQKVEKKKTKNQ